MPMPRTKCVLCNRKFDFISRIHWHRFVYFHFVCWQPMSMHFWWCLCCHWIRPWIRFYIRSQHPSTGIKYCCADGTNWRVANWRGTMALAIPAPAQIMVCPQDLKFIFARRFHSNRCICFGFAVTARSQNSNLSRSRRLHPDEDHCS